MKDTHPRMNAKWIEMVQKKMPEERLAMGCSMFDFSKQLVTRAILKENPDLALPGLRKELFLKFYGRDFDLSQQQAIINYLSSHLRSEPKA